MERLFLKKGLPMKRYVVRRLLMAIPLLLAISFVCFCFINLIPSNPAEVALRVQQTPVITDEIIAAMEEQLGLNKPFFVRYFDWVLGCLHGDFGISYVNPKRTVAGELLRCLRPFSWQELLLSSWRCSVSPLASSVQSIRTAGLIKLCADWSL